MKTIKDTINTLKTELESRYTNVVADVNSAREDGEKYAKDLVAPFKSVDALDKLLSNSVGIMGQMVAGGAILLMSPIKMVSQELRLTK